MPEFQEERYAETLILIYPVCGDTSVNCKCHISVTLIPMGERAQAADCFSQPSLHVDVARHMRDYVEAADKLLHKLFFLRTVHQSQLSRDLAEDCMAALEAEIAETDRCRQKYI
ncbi:hypothetical protein R1sor_011504 [Riccia sorocarpa]|uniref:Uncharacterized protein n=1 Tax=Riccia sorocarpa TaxID=122646 RepID=A0ABD3I158_9MARC